jgi:hypothetical protein
VITTTGPLATIADLLVQAPANAPAGASVRASVTVRVRSAGPRMITTPATSALLVLSGDRVMARADGATDAPAIPLIMRPGRVAPAQAVPDSVRLIAADTGTPLPPGEYALVAVLGYHNDPLNSAADVDRPRLPTAARPFVLVSEPLPMDVVQDRDCG